MYREVIEVINAIKADLSGWNCETPWFRGESTNKDALRPDVFLDDHDENFLLQTFRRKAGGVMENPPPREHTDEWLFLAQHYKVPTRLLDWSEGALFALFFAVNKHRNNPRVYMLNPYALNELATDASSNGRNLPLSWHGLGKENIRRAWEGQREGVGFQMPVALAATYQDYRMLSQRSCFTVHGINENGLIDILKTRRQSWQDILLEYQIDKTCSEKIVRELSWLGISQTSIFPDLDNLGIELKS